MPYLLSDMVYMQGASPYPHLTIDDGTTLVAGGGGGIYVGYTGYGSLTAAGTAGAGITFTSASGTPAAGDWEGLTLGFYCEPASTSLSNVTVEYGGANGMGNVFFYYCDGTLTDSTIQHSSEWGIYRQSCTPTLSGITYASNAAGDLF